MKAEMIARLLPDIFQAVAGSQGPLDGFLAAQEALHEPSERAISGFAERLDPRTAPPSFVYMLAHWMGLSYLLDGSEGAPRFAGGVGRLRELIATTAANGKARGSMTGIVRMLETASGQRGFSIESDPEQAYHVHIRAPAGSAALRSVIERIIEAEKPAFATYELQFAEQGEQEDNQ